MEYRIAIIDIDGEFSQIEQYTKSLIDAGKLYLQNIIDAFNEETVVAYKIDNEFSDILPQIKIRKKTDYRYGEDINSDVKNRNKYLKFLYKNSLKNNNL